jgi:hypothetical protein
MHFQAFDSDQEMQDFMRANAEAAMAGLAQQQKDLTLGSYWVQFDFEPLEPEPMVIFGHVHSETELDEADGSIEDQRLEMETTGLMFGAAASKHFPQPELGYTHQASAWPIEQRLFEAAQEVAWNPHALPHEAKVLLEIAYQSWRVHEMEKQAKERG